MEIPQAILERLKASAPPVGEAHTILLENDYEFIGYHGTTEEGLQKIIPNQFDPALIGTGIGTERGFGFYLSWDRRLAEDYTEEGNGRILRIYVKDLLTLRLGIDYKWGLMRTPGDPNGELDIERISRGPVDLELVLSPIIYSKLAAIPSGGAELDTQLERGRRKWPAYSIDEQLLTVLGQEQTYWFPFIPRPRRNSDVSTWNTLQQWRQFGNKHLSEEARYQKGLKYYYGKGFPQNIEKAIDWFLSATEKHTGAQTMLADIYENGRGGVPIDMGKAVKFYHAAYEKEDAVAAFCLAYCYELGKGVPKDIAKANELFKFAKDRGYEGWSGYYSRFLQRNYPSNDKEKDFSTLSAQEQYAEGELFLLGEVVEQDIVKAKNLFELAASSRHPEAYERLAYIYRYGIGDFPVDKEKAIKFYTMAANLEYEVAMFLLGQCYELGDGISQDLEQALHYYTMAYEKGYEGYENYYNQFVKKHPELTLESGMSHRRFVLTSPY